MNSYNYLDLHWRVLQGNYPNAWGAQIPVPTTWNLELFNALLGEYHDKEVIQWLRYGWPVSRPSNWPDSVPTYMNHTSANKYPDQLYKYLRKEMDKGAVMGPFKNVPFRARVGVSPLSTREKKDSESRHILMDLSWPVGYSVNDGIAKDYYLGFRTKLQFPTIDIMAKCVSELGTSARMFKINLNQYFRQLRIDPFNHSLLCFSWNQEIFFNVMAPMGLRSAPYFAQRVSNAIRYVHNTVGYFLFNYIDDFLGAEHEGKIGASFALFHKTLAAIGIEESTNKRVEPTSKINCVGTWVDAEEMTISVTPDQLVALQQELNTWIGREQATEKELQSLVGKLQFVCNCVRPGRLFLSRMLNCLHRARHGKVDVDKNMKLDIMWWIKYLPQYSGTSILWMLNISEPDSIVASDACLKGLGAVSTTQYLRLHFPPWFENKYKIAHLELWAVIVMCKTWGNTLRGKFIQIRCDNESVVTVLNSGQVWDDRLQCLMREMVYVAAINNFEFKAVHVAGKSSLLPDF